MSFRKRSDPMRPLGLARPARRAQRLRWISWVILLLMTPPLAMAAYEPSVMLGVNNLSELTSQSTARTNLGLGTAATQNSTVFAQVANNLSDVTASTARTNLGLGTIATQAASAVAITGGAIDGTTLGATTRSSVKGTTGDFNGILTTSSGIVRNLRVVIAAGAVTGATTDDIVVVNKTSGAATAYNAVASPVTGATVWIKDGKGDAATNPITFTPAAGNVDGAGTFVLNQNFEMIGFVYNGTQWNVM